jgi:hypothetical protein
MQSINPNDRESLRIYDQFLCDILNEKAMGQKYIEQSKENITGGPQLKLFKNDLNI